MLQLEDAIASDEDLELDSPFMDAGMDSLSSVALMSMVAKDGLNDCVASWKKLSPSGLFDVISCVKIPMTTIVTCRSSKWP